VTPEDEEPRDLYLGRLVDGRYRVTRCIGAGGMGSVYEASQEAMGRRVALKVLHVQLAKSADVLRRFRNEARASATLGHPAIAKAYDFGRTEDGAPFIAMELLEGRNLGEVLEAEGPLSFERAVAIADQIAGALGAAHSASVVHRDVKPENVMILDGPPPDRVKVLDFGISKFADGQTSVATRTGTFLGSPSYMAPEQIHDASRADARTDIYALGAVIYAMLTGRPMFSHSSLPMLIIAITNNAPEPLASLRPDTPAALLELVEHLTHKDPEKRPQTMAEVRAAIAALGPLDATAPRRAPSPLAAANPSVATQPTELAQGPVELPVSRRPVFALAALAGGAALAAAAAYLAFGSPQPATDAAPERAPQVVEAPPETTPEESSPPADPPTDVDPAPAPVATPEVEETPTAVAPPPLPRPATRPPRRTPTARPTPSVEAEAPPPPAPAPPPPTEIDGVPIDDSY
jgi:hypothetical protein